MKSTLSTIVGFALCASLMAGCGDGDAVPGFGGGTICASDNSDAGSVYECPSGDKTFDFCIDSGNGNCYYVVEGEQLNCGNCFEGDTLTNCAQQAAAACD